MTLKTMAAVALGAAMATGCVQNYAEREVAQGAAAGVLVVTNAPPEARLIIDGRDLGAVAQFEAGAPLTTGRHDIAIESGGRRLHAQAVFVSAGARVAVTVP